MGDFCEEGYSCYDCYCKKKSTGSNMFCHDRFVKFKAKKHHSKGDEIDLG